jgi:hypothetical protein
MTIVVPSRATSRMTAGRDLGSLEQALCHPNGPCHRERAAPAATTPAAVGLRPVSNHIPEVASNGSTTSSARPCRDRQAAPLGVGACNVSRPGDCGQQVSRAAASQARESCETGRSQFDLLCGNEGPLSARQKVDPCERMTSSEDPPGERGTKRQSSLRVVYPNERPTDGGGDRMVDQPLATTETDLLSGCPMCSFRWLRCSRHLRSGIDLRKTPDENYGCAPLIASALITRI